MKISLRPARPDDFEFARRLYFEANRWIIETLFAWNEAEQYARFDRRFKHDEARIIMLDGQDIGWLQIQETAETTNLGQFYIAPAFRRRGIGTRILEGLMAEARGKRKTVTLSVVKINPALRLYERLGFRQIREDQHKVHMKWNGSRCTPVQHPSQP